MAASSSSSPVDYQEELSKIYQKKLSNSAAPSVYKWSNKYDPLRHQQKQCQKPKPSRILIETRTTTISRCFNEYDNCDGFEINRRYPCKCAHHLLIHSGNKVSNNNRSL